MVSGIETIHPDLIAIRVILHRDDIVSCVIDRSPDVRIARYVDVAKAIYSDIPSIILAVLRIVVDCLPKQSAVRSIFHSEIVGPPRCRPRGAGHETIAMRVCGDRDWGRGIGRRRTESPGPSRVSAGVVLDCSVTGSAWGASSGSDYLTVKYAPDGTLLWQAIYDD